MALDLNIKIKELLKKLEGIQTIKSVMTLLNVDKKKAIYYVYLLRKHGYVKTTLNPDKTRIYHISFENKLNTTSYYDIINKYSPIKVSPKEEYKVYKRRISIEETLVFAVKTKSLRVILAALALFNYVTNWSKLYTLAKKNHIERQIGALYDVAREIMKVRRMNKTFRNYAIPKEKYPFEYTVPKIRSKDFKNIENLWKIYIPFNKEDLEVYKK